MGKRRALGRVARGWRDGRKDGAASRKCGEGGWGSLGGFLGRIRPKTEDEEDGEGERDRRFRLHVFEAVCEW